MQSKFIVHPDSLSIEKEIEKAVNSFDSHSQILGDAERNVIKVVTIRGNQYAIKSFKIPNIVNQIAYRFIRKSKAERSFIFASKLMELGIQTPKAVAYKLETTPFLFKRSYYVSELLDADLMYRDLTNDFSIDDYDDILRAFTRFTFKLHQNKINFLDHSPGNTLIKRTKGGYDFYLVDLNRMKFEEMDFDTRVKNFAKLTIHKSMVKIMSNEYAICSRENENEIYELMWRYTEEFQSRYYRKDRLKKKILFWRKR